MGVPSIIHAEVSGSLTLSQQGRYANLDNFDVEQDSSDIPKEYIIGILKHYKNMKGNFHVGNFNVQDFNDNGSSIALYCLGPVPFTGISFTFHCKLPDQK